MLIKTLVGPEAQALAAVGATGWYGPQTRRAVEELQIALTYDPQTVGAVMLQDALNQGVGTGVFGPLTKTAAKEYAERGIKPVLPPQSKAEPAPQAKAPQTAAPAAPKAAADEQKPKPQGQKPEDPISALQKALQDLQTEPQQELGASALGSMLGKARVIDMVEPAASVAARVQAIPAPLIRGDKGPEVRALQELLAHLNMGPAARALRRVIERNQAAYGGLTEQAVAELQGMLISKLKTPAGLRLREAFESNRFAQGSWGELTKAAALEYFSRR
jgi:peptidoglycan hydrolase-like protein with peptidoglycan-binding domain